jgi:hypothetical protein
VSYHQGNKNDPLFAASGAIQISPVTIEINKSLKKLKIELPSDPTIPLLNIYPKESKAAYYRDTCLPTFTWHYSQ